MNDISYNNLISMNDDYIIKQIGEFVKHHRIQQNKTQTTLAQEAGISRSTLSLLEKGSTVTIATLIQVLRILEQLQVLNSFIISQQPSPLALAKAEKEKRQRVHSPKKKQTHRKKQLNW